MGMTDESLLLLVGVVGVPAWSDDVRLCEGRSVLRDDELVRIDKRVVPDDEGVGDPLLEEYPSNDIRDGWTGIYFWLNNQSINNEIIELYYPFLSIY